MTAWRATAKACTAVVLSAIAAGCAEKYPRTPVGTDDRSPAIRKPSGPPQHVAGYVVASVGERSVGPFFARRGAGAAASGLVAWLTVAEGTGRRILVVPIGPDGAPRGGETTAASISVDTTMLVVKPLRGAAPGFLLAWTSLTDRGKSLWTLAVGDDGRPRGKPLELTRTTDDIVWIDAVATDHGATCLWAEETRGGDANLIAAPLNTDGNVRASPARVATGIVGWHALEMPGGIGVSTVSASGPRDARAGAAARAGGALAFHRLDGDARALAPPVSLATKSIVNGDVEVARDGSRLVFAWTDRSTEEPSIAALALENPMARDARADPPKTIVEARGGATLVALGSGPVGAALMFEAPARRRGESRRLHLARLGRDLALDRRPLSFDYVGRGQPELAATATGFAILATVADCDATPAPPGKEREREDAATCANPTANPVATMLRTDAEMTLVQREPLTFIADPATIGWALTCDVDTCFALAASPGPPGTPSRVRTAAIRPRLNTKAAPAAAPAAPAGDGPTVTDVAAVASGESVIDLATVRIGTATLVATLSARADAPTPKRGEEARGADLAIATRIVSDTGEIAAPVAITNKALSVGGVAIAAAENPDDGGAIAWVARENGDPEVHVTRIDRRGRRTNDVQLTTTKGDAADVTITWAGGGWIVAWVDGRDGNGEVYATKVGPDLARVAREERITHAPGDASDLVALARGTDVWLAWADPRESPKDGVADVFVSAVKMHDAKRVFDEQRVLATAAHSRTPHLAGGPTGVHLAWIEEAPPGSDARGHGGYGAFWARLDGAGRAADKPSRMALAGEGLATSVAIDVAAAGVQAVVARSTSDAIMLDGIDLGRSKSSPLLALDGPPSLDVALVLQSGILYFNDEGPRLSDRRARRAKIAWK